MRLEPEFLRGLVRERAPSTAFAISLLNERERAGARALFAFARITRDSVNLAASRQEAQASVALLSRLFEFGVVQRYASDHSIVDTVIDAIPDFGLAWEAWSYLEEDFEVPRSYANEFIRGLKQDADGYRPETNEDLLRYVYRTGGVLGLIACHIFDTDELMQQSAVDAASSARLTSLADHVYRDFTLGRNFVPLAWLSFATTQTFAPSWAGQATARFRKLASVLEASAWPNLRQLGFRKRIALALALVHQREARSSVFRKADRVGDVVIRHSADAFWSDLGPRIARVAKRLRTIGYAVQDAVEKRSLAPLFKDDSVAEHAVIARRATSLPVRDLATAMRNQNVLVNREF